MTRPAALLTLALVLAPLQSDAYLVVIAPAKRSLYLQVGTGTMTGGPFNSGGIPGDNPTVNLVTVTLLPDALGTGPRTMSTDSTVTNSSYDGRPFCPVTAPASWVYIGGFYRKPGLGMGRGSTLSVTAPANLVSGADTIPFSSVSWVSAGIGDATPTIPSGSFTGGTQMLLTFRGDYWFESCLQFTYSNTAVFPAGTYTNRATYTLTSP